TYALWSISAHFTGGIVHSGGFNLERYGDEQWHDVSFDVLARGDAGPLDGGRDGGGEGGLLVTGPRDAGGIDLDAVLAAGNTIDVADWLIVPGDAVLGIMEADITLNGHNLAAVLSMEARDDQSGGQGGGLFARGGDDRQPGNLAASLFDLIDNDNVSVNISVVARELDDRDQPGATLKEWTVVGHHRDPASDNCPDSEGGGDGEGDKIDIGEGDINLSDGKEFDGTLGMFVAPQTRRGSDGGQGEGEGSRDAGAGTVVTLGPTGRARVYVIVEVYFDLCTPDMVGEGGIELADIADISLTLDQVRSTATPRPNPTGTIGPKPTPTLTTPVEPPADS
ncbi:MAG: hypothetical protein LBB54_05960, partial [Cellulomonadaceae bacterium]|nr:hypothetical protein [Cellulomonadaceae bacterium]